MGMGKENGNGNADGKKIENVTEIRLETKNSGVGTIAVNSEVNSDSRLGSRNESAMFLENLVWMTSAEAAKYLRKSYGALRVMVCRGYIKPRMFRRRWYFKRIELDRLIENSI